MLIDSDKIETLKANVNDERLEMEVSVHEIAGLMYVVALDIGKGSIEDFDLADPKNARVDDDGGGRLMLRATFHKTKA